MIDRFIGKYDFLSNFHECSIEYKGHRYSSIEHAYQAAKASTEEERKEIQLAKTAGKAKKLGMQVKLRSTWDSEKLQVMEECLRLKFSPGSELAGYLLATGTEELIEGNTWGDKFWGTVKGHGKNHLGQLLMKIRAELEKQKTDV